MIKDIEGNILKVGDVVRIIGVPDLSGMGPDQRAESEPVFQYLIGKYKRITAFDYPEGMEPLAEFQFRMKQDAEWQSHWVWLEPYLLKKKKNRTKKMVEHVSSTF